jgi:hypothetical protein
MSRRASIVVDSPNASVEIACTGGITYSTVSQDSTIDVKQGEVDVDAISTVSCDLGVVVEGGLVKIGEGIDLNGQLGVGWGDAEGYSFFQTGGTVELLGNYTLYAEYGFLQTASGLLQTSGAAHLDLGLGEAATFSGQVTINPTGNGTAFQTLQIDGDCVFKPGSVLNVTCRGDQNGGCDSLYVTGYLNLDGILFVTTTQAYPAVGNQYWFAKSGHAITGAWSSIVAAGEGTTASTWSEVGTYDGTVYQQGLACVA